MSADRWSDCPKCGAKANLREDWELGIWDGVFHIYYAGSCGSSLTDGCGFKKEFNHEEAIGDTKDKA